MMAVELAAVLVDGHHHHHHDNNQDSLSDDAMSPIELLSPAAAATMHRPLPAHHERKPEIEDLVDLEALGIDSETLLHWTMHWFAQTLDDVTVASAEPVSVAEERMVPAGITSLLHYILCLKTLFALEPAVFALAHILLSRLLALFPNARENLRRGPVFRTTLVALLLAHKLTADVPYSNAYWAARVGIDKQTLNAAEAEFAQTIGWNMVCSESDLRATFGHIVARFA